LVERYRHGSIWFWGHAYVGRRWRNMYLCVHCDYPRRFDAWCAHSGSSGYIIQQHTHKKGTKKKTETRKNRAMICCMSVRWRPIRNDIFLSCKKVVDDVMQT